ncbi:MAG: VOC family protein, partial [Rhodothermales bacterium]|nr:VOC family protein [Rhodothermales bacterium]
MPNHPTSSDLQHAAAGIDNGAGASVSLWLDHAAVITSDLERSVDFYVRVIGLRVHIQEEDPLRKGRRRAMLFDSNGRDVMELIEMSEFSHKTVAG